MALDRIYAVSKANRKQIFVYALSGGNKLSIITLPREVYDVAFDANRQVLWGIETHERYFYRYNLLTGKEITKPNPATITSVSESVACGLNNQYVLFNNGGYIGKYKLNGDIAQEEARTKLTDPNESAWHKGWLAVDEARNELYVALSERTECRVFNFVAGANATLARTKTNFSGQGIEFNLETDELWHIKTDLRTIQKLHRTTFAEQSTITVNDDITAFTLGTAPGDLMVTCVA